MIVASANKPWPAATARAGVARKLPRRPRPRRQQATNSVNPTMPGFDQHAQQRVVVVEHPQRLEFQLLAAVGQVRHLHVVKPAEAAAEHRRVANIRIET